MKSLIEMKITKTPGKSVVMNIVADSGSTQLNSDVYRTGKFAAKFKRKSPTHGVSTTANQSGEPGRDG